MAVYGSYRVEFTTTNQAGSIKDTISLKRSASPGTEVFVSSPDPGPPYGETWTAAYSLVAAQVVNLDLMALAYAFGAAAITKTFNGISVFQVQSYDNPGVGNKVDFTVPGTNGFSGPWGASGFSLGLGGECFFAQPGDLWPVNSGSRLLTVTAPGVAVNFGISIQGTRP